jgi:hypothetical protein
MVDQNIGRPLIKILSYRCSTALVLKVWWGSIEIFGDLVRQTGASETLLGGVGPRRSGRAPGHPHARAPRGAPPYIDVWDPPTARPETPCP